MKQGQIVTHVDGYGDRRPATVAKLVDSGPSGFKVLDLVVEKQGVAGVHHFRDRAESADGSYWIQLDDTADQDPQ
jgi:hypothetical protein